VQWLQIVFIVLLQNLVYENGVLLSGPLDSFIQHLVPTASYFPDVCSMCVFLSILSVRVVHTLTHTHIHTHTLCHSHSVFVCPAFFLEFLRVELDSQRGISELL